MLSNRFGRSCGCQSGLARRARSRRVVSRTFLLSPRVAVDGVRRCWVLAISCTVAEGVFCDFRRTSHVGSGESILMNVSASHGALARIQIPTSGPLWSIKCFLTVRLQLCFVLRSYGFAEKNGATVGVGSHRCLPSVLLLICFSLTDHLDQYLQLGSSTANSREYLAPHPLVLVARGLTLPHHSS